jgi:hypothetical protein
MASGDDLSAGLDDHLVGCDSILEIFELGGESAAGFSALLGDAEVSQDVAAGVTHQSGEVHQEVSEDTLAHREVRRSLYLKSEIYLS